MNDCGTILRNRNCDNFADFIFKFALKPENKPTAAHFVETLSSVFPAFADHTTYKGKEVYILKKAQLLAHDLSIKCSRDERFQFPDLSQLSIFSDNVVPAVLRHFGVLSFSKELEKIVESRALLEPGTMEIEIRLLAVQACRVFSEKLQKKFGNDVEFHSKTAERFLDHYLWSIGKKPEIRKIERHYCQKTIYY